MTTVYTNLNNLSSYCDATPQALNGVALKVGTRPSLPISGQGGAQGILQPGQTWTTAVPTGAAVSTGLAPLITPVTDTHVMDGELYSFTPTLDSGDTPATWSLVNPENPIGDLVINPETGEITWSASHTMNVLNFTVKATNLFGSDTSSWTVTVNPVAPVVEPIADFYVAHGVLWGTQPALQAHATSPIGWTLAAPVPAPDTMTFNTDNGALTWLTDNALSPMSFSVVAEGPGGADTVSFTVEVAEMLTFIEQPVSLSAYIDEANTITLSATISGGYNPQLYYWEQRNLDTGNLQTVEMGSVTSDAFVLHRSSDDLGVGNFEYTLTVVDVTGVGDSYHVIVSEPALVRLAERLVLVSDISDALVNRGLRFRWSVEVTGGLGQRHYQWRKYTDDKAWTPVMNGPQHDGEISGANSATLTFTNFMPEFAGTYNVVVTDDFSEYLEAGPATLVYSENVPAAGIAGMIMVIMATGAAGALLLRKRT